MKEKLKQKAQQCFRFDGSTYLEIINDDSVLDQEFTIAVWIKLFSDKIHTIFDKYDHQNQKGILLQVVPVRKGTGVLQLTLGNRKFRGKHPVDIRKEVEWDYVGVSFKNRKKDGVRFFGAGFVDDKHSSYFGVGNVSLPILLGKQREKEENYMNGMIDNLSVWKKALTDVELSSIMYSMMGGKEDGLVAFFDFDDRTDSFLDSSGRKMEAHVKGNRHMSSCLNKPFKIEPCKKKHVQRIKP